MKLLKNYISLVTKKLKNIAMPTRFIYQNDLYDIFIYFYL